MEMNHTSKNNEMHTTDQLEYPNRDSNSKLNQCYSSETWIYLQNKACEKQQHCGSSLLSTIDQQEQQLQGDFVIKTNKWQ
jgi:hypothetical protein